MVDILGTINLGVLSILIPLAIFLFDKLDDSSFRNLDKKVILESVVNAPRLILYIFLLFSPLFLFQEKIFDTKFLVNKETYIHIGGLLIWAAGILSFLFIIMSSYEWIKENKYKFRFSYLKSIKNPTDIINAWNDVWKEKISIENEKQFFLIFSKLVDDIFSKKYLKNSFFEKVLNKPQDTNYSLPCNLLKDFNSSIENRLILLFLVGSPEFFEKILKWMLITEKLDMEYIKTPDFPERYMNNSSISESLFSIFQKIEIMAFKSNWALQFFKLIKIHIEEVQKEGNNDKYIEKVIRVMFDGLLKYNIDSNFYDAHIWEIFPPEWKITNESIKKYIPRIIYDAYIKFAYNKFQLRSENREDYFEIDSVTYHLFPEFDPRVLSWIITLMNIYSSNVSEFLVKNGKKFGFASRPFSEEEFNDKQEILKNNTINFVINIYKQYFSFEKVNSLISDLDETHPTTSEEIFNKESLTEIFSKIKSSIKE